MNKDTNTCINISKTIDDEDQAIQIECRYQYELSCDT